MRTVSAVIGANYGDEGKGLVTDYLSSHETLVVRFCGGAQAGHTVVTPDGRRHVFHHFGSGSFTGAATFLSRYFLSNPMFFREEWHEVVKNKIDLMGKVYIDSRSLITTPYDIMLNQAVEKKRGNDRHGSCGLGINETVERNEQGYRLRFWALQDHESLCHFLNKIRDEYVPLRANQLGLSLDDLPYLMSNGVRDRFLEDCSFMALHSKEEMWEDLSWEGNIVFEGAQGLMLDADHPNFPHVTRAKTGLTNVIQMVKEAKIEETLDVYYVIRAYSTRHGAGPLPYETEKLEFANVVDETNIHNEHQGGLRLAPHDVAELAVTIGKDFSIGEEIKKTKNLVITCVDQLKDGIVDYYYAGHIGRLPFGFFYCLLMTLGNHSKGLVSFGPTREDLIQEHEWSAQREERTALWRT